MVTFIDDTVFKFQLCVNTCIEAGFYKTPGLVLGPRIRVGGDGVHASRNCHRSVFNPSLGVAKIRIQGGGGVAPDSL